MNAQRLEEIKERVAKATPGEWFYDSYTVCTDEIVDGNGNLVETVTLDYADRHGDVHFKEEADAQFIAHARQDVPDLIAEVERLREALAFYANEDNYNVPYTERFSTVYNDDGRIARQALQEGNNA